MQLLKSNPDGTGQTISELDLTQYGSPSAAIEYGRSQSEGGFVTLLGGDFNPQPPPPEPKPGDPQPVPYIPAILAVFNDGNQIVCYIAE